MQILLPVIYEAYVEYRRSMGCAPMGFCARCGKTRLPGELDMDEPDGHHQGVILDAQLDPGSIQLLCSISVAGNSCHPNGAHHHDWLAEIHPDLKDTMIELRKRIIAALPQLAGEMKHSLKTQEQAIKEVCARGV